MAVIYVDVSHHDRNRRGSPLDWAAIAQATGQGEVMCARASYGDPDVFAPPSPYFAEHMAGAKAAGYSWRGGYHNLIRGDAASMRRQVDMLRRALDLGGCVWAMCDIEPYQELQDNGLWPRWADVRRWRDRWAAVDGRVMVWYVGRWVWSGWLGSPDLRELGGPMVNAHYDGGDGTASQIYAAAGGDQADGWAAYGGRIPNILQYSSVANVAGATGNTDANAFRGSFAGLVALLTGGDMTKDEVKAAVLEALATTVPWESAGVAGAAAGAGWNPTSLRALMEYVWDDVRVSKRVAQRADVTALRAVVDQLADIIRAGGGTVDTAAILAGVDARLATHRAQVEADTRDAVADLAEGGAAAVRADA